MSCNKLSFEERAIKTKHPLARELFSLMDRKRSNLSIAADVTTARELLHLVDMVGPHVCVVKTHIDIIEDFSTDLIDSLKELADKHDFILFEDRKFADIGNTVQMQYEGGMYHISDWAHLINAHLLPGPGIIQALREVGLPKGHGLLLLANMSSKGHLFTSEYEKNVVKLAEEHADFVVGFISNRRVSEAPHLLTFTPGVKREQGEDALMQQYNTPETAILDRGADIIIVGRGIITAEDPAEEAACYQELAWSSYEQRCVTPTGRC